MALKNPGTVMDICESLKKDIGILLVHSVKNIKVIMSSLWKIIAYGAIPTSFSILKFKHQFIWSNLPICSDLTQSFLKKSHSNWLNFIESWSFLKNCLNSHGISFLENLISPAMLGVWLLLKRSFSRSFPLAFALSRWLAFSMSLGFCVVNFEPDRFLHISVACLRILIDG